MLRGLLEQSIKSSAQPQGAIRRTELGTGFPPVCTQLPNRVPTSAQAWRPRRKVHHCKHMSQNELRIHWLAVRCEPRSWHGVCLGDTVPPASLGALGRHTAITRLGTGGGQRDVRGVLGHPQRTMGSRRPKIGARQWSSEIPTFYNDPNTVRFFYISPRCSLFCTRRSDGARHAGGERRRPFVH